VSIKGHGKSKSCAKYPHNKGFNIQVVFFLHTTWLVLMWEITAEK